MMRVECGQEIEVLSGDGFIARGFIKTVEKEPDKPGIPGVRYGEYGDIHLRVVVNEIIPPGEKRTRKSRKPKKTVRGK